MFTQVKWISFGLIAVFAALVIAFFSSTQNTVTHTTSEVEAVEESVSAGVIRSGLDESGTFKHEEEEQYVAKEDLVANVVASLVSVQKTQGYDVYFDYLFVDGDGNVTEVEEDIESIQFQVQTKNEEGEVKGSFERMVSINQLSAE